MPQFSYFPDQRALVGPVRNRQHDRQSCLEASKEAVRNNRLAPKSQQDFSREALTADPCLHDDCGMLAYSLRHVSGSRLANGFQRSSQG